MQITAQEFKKAVALDPAWASKLTEPVEVTTPCFLTNSPITHLSPLLTFSGSLNGKAGSFEHCKSLLIAEGTFHGHISFESSGVKEIGELHVTQGASENNAANFQSCKKLKVAQGTFPGYVSFAQSGIEKIGALTILAPDAHGLAANFFQCPNLKVAEGTFPGSVCFQESGVERIGKLHITHTPQSKRSDLADFTFCESLKNGPGFLLKGYSIDDELREAIQTKIQARQVLRKSQEINPLDI